MSISEDQKKEYQKYVKEITPTHSLPLEMGKAFLTGGIICLLGQLLQNAGMALGLEQEAAGIWCSILLVLVSVLLTDSVLSAHCQMGRCRRPGSHHRFCQWRCFFRYRIQKGRAGLRHRCQNLHHCRFCHPVRCAYFLGSGTLLLVLPLLAILTGFCYSDGRNTGDTQMLLQIQDGTLSAGTQVVLSHFEF